jgi:LAS superfamily LD-carboxypeptidase LdcB
MPDPYDPVIFKEHQEQIVELKNVLSKVPDEITSQEIEIEKHNQSAQAQAEYEAEQAKNLMTMVAQQQTEFRQKLKKAALRSEEREKIVNDKSVSMDEEVQVTPHVSATFDHSEFIKTLKKFNVDPTWLKNT